MNRFRVRALGENGELITRLVEAENPKACERMLSKDALSIISVSRAKDYGVTGRHVGLSVSEQSEFASVVSSLLNSSLGIRDALDLLCTIAGKRATRELSARLIDRLDKGQSFAAAMSAESRSFPSIVLGLVSIGERTGDLAKSFARIVSYTESRRKVRSSLFGALAYPVLVLAVMIFGSAAIGIYAIPKLTQLFSGMGGTAAVEMATAMSRARASILVLFTCLFCLGFFCMAVWFLHARGGDANASADRFLLSVPFMGKLMTDSNTLDFCFAMEALVSAGVTMDDALKEAEESVSNEAYRRALRLAREEIHKGCSLSRAFSNQRIIPAQIPQWLAVGERTGKVDQVFMQLREYYQETVTRWTTVLLNLAEPMISVLMGAFIVFLVVTFVLPLFNAYGSML